MGRENNDFSRTYWYFKVNLKKEVDTERPANNALNPTVGLLLIYRFGELATLAAEIFYAYANLID